MQKTGALHSIDSIHHICNKDGRNRTKKKKVDQFFENVWSPEGHQLIQFLARNEELREQKRQHINNSVACSKASFVSGVWTLNGFVASPPTCGLSLPLTTAGTSTGPASGFAGIANHYKHSIVVLKNSEKTLESIGKHVKRVKLR